MPGSWRSDFTTGFEQFRLGVAEESAKEQEIVSVLLHASRVSKPRKLTRKSPKLKLESKHTKRKIVL